MSALDIESPKDGGGTPTNDNDFQKNVTKRIDAMTDRQDSIQALSMWIIHHKNQCQKITNCWLAALKRAKVPRRLHLWYLANDVVQNCKKKNAKIYLLAFKGVLKDAVVLVRDPSISPKIERMLHIWEERSTYFIDFINELKELLNDRDKVSAHVSSTNFQPQDLVESIKKVKMLETHVGMKQKQVANLKFDASSIAAVKQLKDRSDSHSFAKRFDDSYHKMQSYVKILENEIAERGKLIGLLENGQTFYEVQNGDAMVVANAYRNFGIRIGNFKKHLDEFKETLESDSPPPSPSAEAPSPGSTPKDENTEEVDMELSDTDEANTSLIEATTPTPIVSTSSLSDRLAQLGDTLPGSGSTDPRASAYDPVEHLKSQKEKAATVTSAAAKDKSVLKDLTAFAEKVKNPPPVSWSDYKRKQQEKFKSLERPQSEQSPVPETTPPQEEPEPLQGVMPPMNDNLPTLPPPKPALQVEEDESVLTNHTVYSPYQPSTSEEESVAPSLPPSHPTKTSDSPLQAPVQLPSPVPAMLPSAPAGVRPLIQPPVHIPGQVLPRPPIQEPVRPPTQISTGAAGPVPPRQPGLAPVRQPIRHTSQPGIRPVAVRMRSVTPQSATRPPMRHPIQPGVSRPQVRMSSPPVYRPPITTVPPVPPAQSMSADDQRDALNFLDSIHAEAGGSTPTMDEDPAIGAPIQTLGQQTVSSRGGYRGVRGAPVPNIDRYGMIDYGRPGPPPPKRSYYDYGYGGGYRDDYYY